MVKSTKLTRSPKSESIPPRYVMERGNSLIPDYEPAYASLPRDQASLLEDQVKADYQLTDWHDPDNPSGYAGWKLGDRTNGREILWAPNSRSITTKEYLRKDDKNQPTENVLDLVARVAVNVATAEAKYGGSQEEVLETAKRFAKRMLYREFAPNTPTFANAGGHLQQLAACFGMIPEDHLGTDDIGEDPDKQGNGIFDILRYGAMIQKSGGGTGYNFSYTRPKNSGIATTGGRASGPVSWLKAYNAATQEINQGGFRRGANMGVLEYWHQDIFEFLSAKANHHIPFFNLSMGIDEKFWNAFEKDENFYLTTPRDMDTVPEEKRRLKANQLLKRSEFDKLTKMQQEDLDPSLLLEEDGKQVTVRYTGKKVGFIDDKGFVNISAKSTLEYAAEMANTTGCPGIIFFDRMNKDNPTPNAGPIRVVNPCGEQPLLNFEACNLGSANVYSCIEEVKKGDKPYEFGRNGKYFYGKVIGEGEHQFQRRLNLEKLEEIVSDGVHFLDNVIDMGKYPFKKVYSHVKANRKIGLGIMGLAETAAVLGIAYESEDMEQLSGVISSQMSEKAFNTSVELAAKRGEFPNWQGSIYDPKSPHAVKGKTKKVRNATRITIAPNGTTGQFAGVTGGGEPMIGIIWNKNLANGISLKYMNQVFVEELRVRGLYSEGLVEKIRAVGTVQTVEEVPEDMKARYKQMTEVSPEWHVRIQGALQVGQNGWGVDNAVSKTVNLPRDSTSTDFLNIFLWARKYGCKGSTGYRDGTIAGQPLTLGDSKKATKVNLLEKVVRVNVPIDSPAISMADNSTKYRIDRKRGSQEDTFHVIFTDELRRDPKTGNVYMFPKEDFQQTAPLGDEIAVEFASAGLDRTGLLKEEDPDYVKMIERWKSVTGNRSSGIGPSRINSPTHGVGLVFEHALLSRGIVKYDDVTNQLFQVIRKKDTIPLTAEEKASILNNGHETIDQKITSKVITGFLCPCGSAEYIFTQGCHEPKCSKCGWSKSGDCS